MSVKPADYVRVTGTVPEEFIRPVKINDKTQNLVVTLKMNNKKGTFEIITKWNYQQITNNESDDAATLKMYQELMMEARRIGLEWKEEWQNSRSDKDPNQGDLFKGKDAEGESATQV